MSYKCRNSLSEVSEIHSQKFQINTEKKLVLSGLLLFLSSCLNDIEKTII